MSSLLGECAASGGDGDISDTLLRAAEAVFARLLREGCGTRESALDLLAADAFVTYAFEAAAAEPGRMVERTEEAMSRIAALAELPVAAAAAPSLRAGA